MNSHLNDRAIWSRFELSKVQTKLRLHHEVATMVETMVDREYDILFQELKSWLIRGRLCGPRSTSTQSSQQEGLPQSIALDQQQDLGACPFQGPLISPNLPEQIVSNVESNLLESVAQTSIPLQQEPSNTSAENIIQVEPVKIECDDDSVDIENLYIQCNDESLNFPKLSRQNDRNCEVEQLNENIFDQVNVPQVPLEPPRLNFSVSLSNEISNLSNSVTLLPHQPNIFSANLQQHQNIMNSVDQNYYLHNSDVRQKDSKQGNVSQFSADQTSSNLTSTVLVKQTLNNSISNRAQELNQGHKEVEFSDGDDNEDDCSCSACNNSDSPSESDNLHSNRSNSNLSTSMSSSSSRIVASKRILILKQTSSGQPTKRLKTYHSNNNKRYKCPQCYKSFDREDYLKHHLNVHTSADGRPFNLPLKGSFCGIRYKMKDGLARHVQSIHNGDRYKCAKCGYLSARRFSVFKHIRTVHFRLPGTLKEQHRQGIVDTRNPQEFIHKVTL